jgi:dolichyl-phosphate-mannose-protein mannosyltransferase
MDSFPEDVAGPRWTRRDTIAAASVTFFAGLVRFLRITVPDRIVFDEAYYAADACTFVHGGGDLCGIARAFTDEHPHLGKWLIAAGIDLFGYTPFGWRVGPAVIGVLGVALLYVLARRLFGSTIAATAASGLLAIDLLWFVHSRIAMLDIFVSTFALAAILFVVLDRDRDRGGVETAERVRDRPWLAAAGFACGAAAASKWSGLWFLPTVAMLAVAWDLRHLRELGIATRVGTVLRRSWRPGVVSLAVMPALVYVVSFGNRFRGGLLVPPWSRDSWWWNLAQRQWSMLTFHLDFEGSVFPYTSPAWSWPFVKRPVVYAFEEVDGRYAEILAMGNPVVWIAAVAALLVLFIRWARRRDRGLPDGVILAGFAAAYLPWLLLTQRRSFVFLFYLLPAVPFMILALVRVGQLLWGSRAGRVLATASVVLTVALAVFFYPVVANVPMEPGSWDRRMWFRDCDPALLAGDPPHIGPRPGPPPEGWCWR